MTKHVLRIQTVVCLRLVLWKRKTQKSKNRKVETSMGTQTMSGGEIK